MLSSFRKIVENILIVALIGVIIFCGYKVIPQLIDGQKANQEKEAISDIIKAEDENRFSQKAYNALKEENSDFVGYLKFDSGILALPVVQAKDNDYYLRRSFYKEYNDQGIPFLDYNCSLNSQNIVIYGHNVYYDDNAMFSPLSFLTDQEKYEENKTFKFYLDGQIRYYEIVNVYIVDTNELNFDFQKTDFKDEDEFNQWYATVLQNNVIDSGKTLTFNDNFITFQTCKRFYESGRIIILAKETNRTSY